MLQAIQIVTILLIAITQIQCDGSPSDNQDFTLSVSFVDNAIQTLPMFGNEIDIDNFLTVDEPDPNSDGDELIFDLINEALGFQCHRSTASLDLSYCPEDISETTSNEFDYETIVGIVSRSLFEIYTYYPDNLDNERCQSSNRTEEIVGAVEFTPEASQDFSLIDDTLWECFESKDGNDDVQIFTMFNKAQDNLMYALTQYRIGAFDGSIHEDQVLEFYGRRENPNDTIFALQAWNVLIFRDSNDDNADDETIRLVSILNPTTRNFVLKFTSKRRDGATTSPYETDKEFIILGAAGYNFTGQSFSSGQYLLRTRIIQEDEESFFERTYCISNQSTPSFLSSCTNINENAENFFDNADGFFETDGVFDFLNMSAEDQTHLSQFSEIFDTPDYLENSQLLFANDLPTSIINNDDADEDDD